MAPLRGSELAKLFDGQVSLEFIGDGVRPWRLRHEERRLYACGLAAMAATAAVRLRGCFRGCSFLHLEAQVAEPEHVDLDALKRTAGPLEYEVFVDGCFIQRQVAQTASNRTHSVHFVDLPCGTYLELWLPTSVALDILFLDTDGELEHDQVCRPRWLCYGSSITHGGPSGSSASCSWPGLCARAADWQLFNLGFGAECYLDPSVAMVIRDTPCDIITLEVGINIQTTAAMTSRTFSSALMGFIRTIRETHAVPILVISPLRYGPLEDRAPINKADFLSLKELRGCVSSCVQTLVALGDQNLHYCDGLQLLQAEELLFDGLHPGPEGQRQMAAGILNELWSIWKGPQLFLPPKLKDDQPQSLTGGYMVEMPGEVRPTRTIVKALEGSPSRFAGISDRGDWPPAQLHLRDEFVFVLNMPGVWGQVEQKQIRFNNGAVWHRVGQVSPGEKNSNAAVFQLEVLDCAAVVD